VNVLGLLFFNQDPSATLMVDGKLIALAEEYCDTIWKVENGNYKIVNEIKVPRSIGWYYSCFAKFCGFDTKELNGCILT